MHVALRRRQITMSGEFLDGPRRRASHRQVRTKSVTEHVRTVVVHTGHARRPADVPLDESLRQSGPVVLIQHQRTTKMAMIPHPASSPARSRWNESRRAPSECRSRGGAASPYRRAHRTCRRPRAAAPTRQMCQATAPEASAGESTPRTRTPCHGAARWERQGPLHAPVARASLTARPAAASSAGPRSSSPERSRAG